MKYCAQYTKIIGDNVVVTGPYMEAYIPLSYFNTKLANELGDKINVMGLFNVQAFDDKNNPKGIETFNYPSMIDIYPSDIEVREMELIPGSGVEKYKICKFYKNDIFTKTSSQKNYDNVNLFFNLVFKGKLPRTIPYNKTINVWRKNLEINSFHLGVPSSILEMMLAEIYRCKNNTAIPFSKQAGKSPKEDMLDYIPANPREICARSSTFAAIIFEDKGAMITASINRDKYNRGETISPVEQIIKY